MATGYFITGTDTGVGKTVVACALLQAFAARGRRVVGMKPVAAGALRTEHGLLNDDVAALCAASNVKAPPDLVNPYCFEAAIAPHLAAKQAGTRIELGRIAHAYAGLAAAAEVVVVEGAGGFCVPLSSIENGAHLARLLGLPVIMVVGMRLGCLNHALLTAQAIRAHGLVLAGWVANRIDPGMAAADENVAALVERMPAPLLADLAHTLQPQRVALQLQALDAL